MRFLATTTILALTLIFQGSPDVIHAQTGSPVLLVLSTFNAVGFTPTTVGATSVQPVTITNGGTGSLVISSVAVGGLHAGDFAVASNGCGTVAPGGVCSVTISFTPAANGDRRGRLVLANNASGAPHEISLAGRGIDPAVPQPAVGPIDPRVGFPVTYTDHNNTTLELCLDHTPSPVDPLTTLCLAPTPDPTQPPSVTDTNVNFGGEAFWWTAEAAIDDGNVDALLVLAQEAAFFTEDPAVNEQVAFGRLRIRFRDGIVAGEWYRFTHPFGVDDIQAPADGGDIFVTSDIGCFNFPCDFSASFASRITHFLRCVAPAPPAGYVGDPAVECTVTGSPLGTNFFRLARISGPGGSVLQQIGETNLFTVSGKIADGITPPPPTNTAPTAVNDIATTAFETAVTIPVLANDSDADGDPLVISAIVTPASNGSAVISAGATVYTPNAGYSGPDAFLYEISDGRGGTATASVNVTVGARLNTPPVANPDSATTNAGVAVTIFVLANDTDADADPLSVTGVTQGSGGAAQINPNGSITYSPVPGFSGADAFTYTISDGRGGVATGAVTVSVIAAPVNRAPIANADSATTAAGTPVTISVLANDSDPDLDPLTVTAVANLVGGTAAVNAGTTVTFTPAAGFSGAGSFSYTISDGRGGSASAAVSVTVSPAPVKDDLVLALGFNEATGTTVIDSSDEANDGVISGATRAAGRFGGGLSFDGVNDWVTVADAVSLDLSTAMTLEAWVRPTALGAGVWRTVMLKEAAAGMAYEMYANNDVNRPATYATINGTIRGITGTAALALNAWTHLATTYDGANLRFYVNGVLVRTIARTGTILATTGPLHIGGNQVWGGEFFAGLIDEVRVYSRALSLAEIQGDMNTPLP